MRTITETDRMVIAIAAKQWWTSSLRPWKSCKHVIDQLTKELGVDAHQAFHAALDGVQVCLNTRGEAI